ncbi:MAG: hypothetical protein HY808_10370 [Nitrospirae bacterium]|nr:hypothetical protein [Nitrospirota bacterium]
MKNRRVVIDLPEDFKDEKVEVIILPYTKRETKKKLSEVLMKGPVLGEDDIKAFLAVREDMKRWKPAKF